MRTHLVAAVLCVQWVLWATPVHGALAAGSSRAEMPAVASHCAPHAPAASSAAERPAPAPLSGRTDRACMLHCTTVAQVALAAVPSIPTGGLLLLALPSALQLAPPHAAAKSSLRPRSHGPPAGDLLLQNSILRL